MQASALRFCLRLGLVLCALYLAGCASAPPRATPPAAELNAFSLQGRFALRQDDKNHSGRLSWQHTDARDDLLLATPFGQGIAAIAVNAEAATLTTGDGKVYSAPDAQTLTERTLGFSLPLSLLTDWVRGRPGPAEVVERDGHGRPLRLRHADWRIDYGYAGESAQAPPDSLFAERAGLFELRLRIDEWDNPPLSTTLR